MDKKAKFVHFTLLNGSPMTLALPRWIEDARRELTERYSDESRIMCMELTEHCRRKLSEPETIDIYAVVDNWINKSPCIRSAAVIDSEGCRHNATVNLIKRTIFIDEEVTENDPN